MPAWVVSIAVADSVVQHNSDGSLIIGDFEANIKQIYFTIDTRPGIRRLTPDGAPRVLVPVQQDRGLMALAFDSQHALLATLSWDNCLRVFDTSTPAAAVAPAVAVNENGGPFTALHYDRVKQQVVTVDRQGFMALFRAADAAMLATKRVCGEATVALVGAAPDALAVGTAAGAAFWRIRRELPYNVFRGGHRGPVIALYACSGGLGQVPGESDFRIFSASLDGTLRLWDPETLACLRVFRGGPSDISSCTFFGAWNTLVSGHDCGAVVLWNVATGTPHVLRRHSNTVSCMKLGVVGRDLEHLVTGSYDGHLGVWDIRAGGGHRPDLTSRWLASGRSGTPAAAAPAAAAAPQRGVGSGAPMLSDYGGAPEVDGDDVSRLSSRGTASAPGRGAAAGKDPYAGTHEGSACERSRGSSEVALGEDTPGGARFSLDLRDDEAVRLGCMHGAPVPDRAPKQMEANCLAAAAPGMVSGVGATRCAAVVGPVAARPSARPSAIAAAAAAAAAVACPHAPSAEASRALVRPAAAAADDTAVPDSSRCRTSGRGAAGLMAAESRASDTTAGEAGPSAAARPSLQSLRKFVSFAEDAGGDTGAGRGNPGSAGGARGSDGDRPEARFVGQGASWGPGSAPVRKALSASQARRTGVVPEAALRREVRCVCFQLGGGLLCSGGADALVRMWKPAHMELIAVGRGHHEAVTCMAHDRNVLFSGSEDTQILAWDLCGAQRAAGAPAELQPLFALRGHAGAVAAVVMLPQVALLASCGADGVLLLWDYVARRITRRIQHAAPLLCIAARADRPEILVGSQDASILRFPMHDPEPRREAVIMEEAMASAEQRGGGAGDLSQGVARFGLVPAAAAALAVGKLQVGHRPNASRDGSQEHDEELVPVPQTESLGCPLEPLPSCVTDNTFVGRGS